MARKLDMINKGMNITIRCELKQNDMSSHVFKIS